MNKIYFGSSGLEDWQARLADPQKHWKQGRSAFELATSWESAAEKSHGLPTQIKVVLDSNPELQDSELLIALPEHAVALEGKGFASYNDLWALLGNSQGLISLAIEAKAGESFDKTIEAWLEAAPNEKSYDNRTTRLEGLCRTLGANFDIQQIGSLRYQLFHRTASALLEAKRFHAKQAVVIVQDFSGQGVGFADFTDFGNFLGLRVVKEQLSHSRTIDGIDLRLGWISCQATTSK